MNIDTAIIDFPCPNCARYINQSIGEIKLNHAIICSCGQRIPIDGSELKAAIRVIRKMLRKTDDDFPAEEQVAFPADEFEIAFDRPAFRKPS